MVEGHIYTEGIVKSDYPEKLKAQIAALPADTEIIIHHISSPGGNVYAAWKALPELMKVGKPIRSLIEGEASSISSWLAIAPATEVYSTDPSTMMIHEPFFPDGLEGDFRVDDLENAKTELSQIRQSMAESYAKKSGRPVQEWLDIMKKNTRMTAGMAKSFGLVDKVLTIEPHRIAALVEGFKEDFNTFKSDVMKLFGNRAVANAPAAIDLKLKDGGAIHVETENGDLVGKPATKDGAPAEGSYALEDGRTLVCVGGKVTAVTEAMAQQTPQQKAEAELARVTAELNAIKMANEAKMKADEDAKAKAAAEQATKALEDEKIKVAALAKQVEELEKKTVGNGGKPNEGMKPNRTPVGFGGKKTSDHDKKIMASRTFLADNMPWMEQFYAGGKYEDGTPFSSYRSDSGPNAVSILETSFSYTWPGILTTDLFYKPTLNSPALSDLMMIDPGTRDKKQYNIVTPLNKILQPYFGCTTSPNGNRALITNKAIQVKEFRMYEGWCKDDFTHQLDGQYNYLAQEWLKSGEESFDPAGTPIDRIIVKLLQDALRRDIFRRVFFADSSSTDTDYNQFDGYWQSLIDQSGASNYCVYRYGAALGTGTLAANTASAYFAGMYSNSSLLLQQEFIDTGAATFQVTRSVWNNYYDTLVAVGSVSNDEYNNYLNGIKTLTFRGIPVIPISLWDSFLAESDNPLTGTTRHLISLTPKENHILGIDAASDMKNIQSWYEMKDSKRYYRADMKLGFLGALHCELTTIAY